MKNNEKGISISYTDLKTSKDDTLEFDKALISVGRKPNTKNLNLDNVGVKLDSKMRVQVNKNFETSIKNI